ncbi:MBL fold metallo-hydrolase [Nocardioides sp. GY 10127]|uniref:MBL fold metallo-hydrolase n=1 Tax=Nocardioides sp. GY 10127 TaxID=2569762 RepID=UPI0010A8EE00|nr:MBL fold metallo-hydrolase [Nocardioides sp. GY 10127]TIC79376.1 MBL fold metallo-hydrolase [Nocardioides sp. GY 10127]
MTQDTPASAPPTVPTDTAHAVSPDSGRHWADPGAWPAAPGVHRIPLPLPEDGLKAVNVYALESDDGLTLVDGGWAIPEARDLLDSALRSIGSGFGDVRRFLVTHVHRDHYTLARVLGTELGVDVTLGSGERPALDYLAALHGDEPPADRLEGAEPVLAALLRSAGAHDLADLWAMIERDEKPGEEHFWAMPDTWLEGDVSLSVGGRRLDAVHTPGHTPGHYVFADEAAGLLLAGDHVLPTITPSIGFTVPPDDQPLGHFMASLTRVRALPDLAVLPAHGPVGMSSHARCAELLAHHEDRLARCLAALGPAGSAGLTGHDVAGTLGWTRRETAYSDLDPFSAGLAAMETKAHLELLVARGDAVRTSSGSSDSVRFTLA